MTHKQFNRYADEGGAAAGSGRGRCASGLSWVGRRAVMARGNRNGAIKAGIKDSLARPSVSRTGAGLFLSVCEP